MFFRKKKSRGKAAVPDWRRTIPQIVKIGDTGSAKKLWWRSFRRASGVAASALAMILLTAVVAERLANGGDDSGRRIRIARLNLTTDGALDEAWVRAFSGVGESGADVSVSALRKKLESYPQIRRARVSRDDGDALRVELEERVALARFRDADGKIFIVGDDGVLFPAETHFGTVEAEYPFVEDAVPATLPNGFRTLAETPPLMEFLNFAFREHRATLKGWESVSAKDLAKSPFPARFPQPWRLLRVRPRPAADVPADGAPRIRIREIVFSAQNFREEFALFDSEDCAKKLRGRFDPDRTYRVVFISNRKNERRPITEMRLVPDEPAPRVPAARARRAGR